MTLYDPFRPSRDSGGYRGPGRGHHYRGTIRTPQKGPQIGALEWAIFSAVAIFGLI